MKIVVIHGPNLQLLGTREPELYGAESLADVDRMISELAGELGVQVETFQSNHEGEILDFVARAAGSADGFLVNPGALTHTSVAFRDALVGVGRPFVEVHISNTAGREPFRAHSYLSPVAAGVVFGFGVQGYLLGFRGLASRLSGA
ncbi:MAG: type II 3-dehydroquinate dehydratase [Gemmatimonadota bacterium]